MAKKLLISKVFSAVQNRLAGARQSPALRESPQANTSLLKLLFFIVDLHNAHVVSGVFVEEKVRFHFICTGKGTANSEILDLLGIGANDKAVVICLEQEILVPVLMKEVRKKLKSGRYGTGIAFTIPLSAINDPVLLVFKQSILKNEKITVEPESSKAPGGNMADDFSSDLIVSIVNQGYSDELMNTARAAGASGGTVLNARGQAHEGAVKFFGISVQDEKELILILTSKEKKVSIMRAICEAHGLGSEAHGIIFSLPVDDVMGLNLEMNE